MEFKYGMRLRGFSIGCQPKEGFIRREDDDSGKYHDLIIYGRPLTVEEVRNYDLDRLFGYTDIKNQRQEEFNKLPFFYAFSDKQLEDELAKRGLTLSKDDLKKVSRLDSVPGTFFLKADTQVLQEYYNRPDPMDELMKDPGFAETAFYYEMGNHEYHINWQADWDVCSCFGNCEFEEEKDYRDYLKEIGFGDEIILAYKKARARFLHDADEKGWY